MENKKILVVEDDTFLRQLIAAKMEADGFDIFVAVDADATFKYLEESKPEIILLDLMLPGLNGFQILEEIKKDPKNKEIPVVILSNLSQKEDIDRAMLLGAKDFWVKAYLTLDDIVEKIDSIIGKQDKA